MQALQIVPNTLLFMARKLRGNLHIPTQQYLGLKICITLCSIGTAVRERPSSQLWCVTRGGGNPKNRYEFV
jgi:hypothetical protein